MEQEQEMEILEPYELSFSDLKLLSSSPSSSSFPDEELDRLKSMVRSLIENLGPNGPGLITITGVPKAPHLRRKLLPLARRLALLNSDDRKSILKEHGLGSDVPLKNPDRTVSSFAMQLKYSQGDSINSIETNHKEDNSNKSEYFHLQNLGNTFKGLGFCMMDLGLCLARICDLALGGLDLEKSLLDSSSAKGRLIHYHSSLDNRILRESAKRNKSTKKRVTKPSTGNGNQSDMWQQWHYDYGLFTILTLPIFIMPKDTDICTYNLGGMMQPIFSLDPQYHIHKSMTQTCAQNINVCPLPKYENFCLSGKQKCPFPEDTNMHKDILGGRMQTIYSSDPQHHIHESVTQICAQTYTDNPCLCMNHDPLPKDEIFCSSGNQECPSPSGDTYLKIFNRNKNKVQMVKADPESLIIQVGEAAEILSRGKLRANLHSVSRPEKMRELSRETFVVFLQPRWDKRFSISDYSSERIESCVTEDTSIGQELHEIVPPLSSRLKDGMTFAEFSLETMKQYFGGRGLQSNR